jgi:hypothetical protein
LQVDSVFEQAGGIGFDGAAMRGGLTRKLGLKFGREINHDGILQDLYPLPYRRAPLESRKWNPPDFPVQVSRRAFEPFVATLQTSLPAYSTWAPRRFTGALAG